MQKEDFVLEQLMELKELSRGMYIQQKTEWTQKLMSPAFFWPQVDESMEFPKTHYNCVLSGVSMALSLLSGLPLSRLFGLCVTEHEVYDQVSDRFYRASVGKFTAEKWPQVEEIFDRMNRIGLEVMHVIRNVDISTCEKEL